MVNSYIPSSGDRTRKYGTTTWIFDENFKIHYQQHIELDSNTGLRRDVIKILFNLTTIPSDTKDYITSFKLNGDEYIVTPPDYSKFQTRRHLFMNGIDVVTGENIHLQREVII
ncbi:hypothetical protein PPL_00624 [Heterostelium album PN500]|uniref:Uncharacterized protein n=1 Tax=Heterostelium pallidum (strain ATCC 26659 / Pp 5 / PN500) TaxID=670386 RepID=D3AWZ6_HETP5|nr:hypothetical protein PPL_00624 [Heterostelium album PN500]EFA86819.1 hypothetical protein PPL_00624 [Heterostelium album PN500]|eukprot:XP_020438922.1 hypothetical protein PPL_00624 [Heterostelium album PN500]